MLWRILAPDTISVHDVSIKILRRFRAEHSCPHHKIFKKVCCVPSCFWVLWPTLLSEELPVVLTAEQANEFYEKGMRHLEVYGYLNWLSQRQAAVRGHGVLNKALWQLLPKYHHFMHMLEDVRDCKINPSFYTLLCAESYIGQIGRIARTCHRATLHFRALQRYKLLMALHFANITL